MEEVESSVTEALDSSGQPLDARTRAFMEPRFGHDFGQVRVHTDRRAAESAARIGAHAYTVGQNMVFSAGEYRPDTSQGRQLMAHELTHTVQQGATPTIQCDVEDPQRFREVHEALFHNQPGGGGAMLQWVDPAQGVPGTEEALFQQAKSNIQQFIQANPASVGGTVTPRTTEADLDTDAIEANRRICLRFPVIPSPASEAQIRSAVSVMTPALTNDVDYQRQWLANRLPGWSDSELYNITETDLRMVALLDRLLNDPDVGSSLKTMASRAAGFQRGEGQAREIFLHEGIQAQNRPGTLYHELTHFYSHTVFRDWVATTTNSRWYNDGFAEYLARLAMPDPVRVQRTQYQDRWDSINTEVAPSVPEDDIARAYFLGEVWRIETASTVSRREAGAQLDLQETATAGEEKESSRTGPGINQTVMPGQHYRFMNIGFDRPAPKPEHVGFFRQIKSEHLDPAPAVAVCFVGHASTAGSLEYNEQLSSRRAQAFYEMAQTEGVSGDRLIGAANPPHLGETRVTATEEDPATRAFNRRVEMILQPVAAGATVAQANMRRSSRIDVATSVQAHLPSYPDSDGGLLTQALLARLGRQGTTPSAATAAVGAGERRFGSSPGSDEERAGVSVGQSATAASGSTPQRRAVVIGNGDYDPATTSGHTMATTNPLPSSLTDSSRIATALSDRGYDVSHLPNQTATQIDSALTSALSGLSAGSELFFYYSGHGTLEGLIGIDGTAFTQAQMLSIRSAARTALVDLIINTDACHSGVFADAIRGAELRDTRTSAAGGSGGSTNAILVAALDAAIAVQDAKDAYNTAIQGWWEQRWVLEAAMAAPPPMTDPDIDPRGIAWSTHYQTAASHWNDFVTTANPLLHAMRIAAATAGIALAGLTLTSITSPYNSDAEMLVQAGLDDVDTLTNQVLTEVDGRLP
ncbi:MAG: DUF4157 domain-containing protein [Dehalococcoidia bacterium]|nr:DUF4157 domain-containing protein [Dehalococcoidia bacterium]